MSDQRTEINTEKKTLINDVGILNDSASALEHFYIANAARKLFFTTTEYVKQIRAVDKNEIVSVAKNISLDQIFILRSSSTEHAEVLRTFEALRI